MKKFLITSKFPYIKNSSNKKKAPLVPYLIRIFFNILFPVPRLYKPGSNDSKNLPEKDKKLVISGREVVNLSVLSSALDNLNLKGFVREGQGCLRGIIRVNSLVFKGQSYLEKGFDINYGKFAAFYVHDLISRTILLSNKSPKDIKITLYLWPTPIFPYMCDHVTFNNNTKSLAKDSRFIRSFSTCSYHSAVKPYDRPSKKLDLTLTGEQATNYSYLLDELDIILKDYLCYTGFLTIYNKDTSNDNTRDWRQFSFYLGCGTVHELTELISETIESAEKTPQMVNVHLHFWSYNSLTRKMLGPCYQRLLCEAKGKYLPTSSHS